MNKKTFKTKLAGKELTIEIGHLAHQANAACTVQLGDTVVLITATMGDIREGVSWFPLSVEYEEKLYAAGKIKGSRWIKREGRPTDVAVLTGRMIDRCIRPLFPDGIKNEIQVVVTVLSYDGENDPDVVSMIGASAALAISDIPWNGPLSGVRTAKVDDKWVVNPSVEVRKEATVELFVCGKEDKLLMVELEGAEVSEDDAYKGIELGVKEGKVVIDLINKMVKEVGREKITPEVPVDDEETPESLKEVQDKASQWLKDNMNDVLFAKKLPTKLSRKQAIYQAKDDMMEWLEEQGIGKDRRKKADPVFSAYVDGEITRAILEEDKRVDGRKLNEIRELGSEVGILPRTHGSGLFNRGETQVLSIVTLGSPGDAQMLDGLEETGEKYFMHHYNFPPFSVGETGRMFGPGRREIGHGALAEKDLKPLIPDREGFPYTIRLVSETLGSNGSSSMASVCGSSLALMDAGVPMKKAIAGIAMGLASDETKGKYKVLSDIQDLEDGSGGMDFKIAGTVDGITAMQLDTKTSGIPMDVVKQTLSQGREARLEILKVMAKAIAQPRQELSEYAPKIISFSIDPDKIREVIGPGGKVINSIIDEHGVQIDIEDDGTVMVTGDEEGSKKAVEWIKNLVKEPEVGEEYTGKVSRMFDFGAMVEILPGKDGMVHISELSHDHVKQVSDVVNLGDEVRVKVIKIDEKGRTNLSIKALQPRSCGSPDDKHGRGSRQESRPAYGNKPRHHS